MTSLATKPINLKTFWSAFGALIMVLVAGLNHYESRIRTLEVQLTNSQTNEAKLESRLVDFEKMQNQMIIWETKTSEALEAMATTQQELKDAIQEFNKNFDFFYDLNPQLRRPGRPDVQMPTGT